MLRVTGFSNGLSRPCDSLAVTTAGPNARGKGNLSHGHRAC